MSRQVRRWIAMGVLGAILAVTFVQLGQWQLRRLEERRERNATVVAHEAEGVQPYADVMNKAIQEEDQWYRVTATGTYLPDQFQVRYRSNNDALGSEVLAVMETDQGDTLLVDRGFMVRQPGQPDGELPATASGTVTVTGYVRRNERGDENAMTPHESSIRLINSDVLSRALGTELVNGYITVIESDPAEAEVLVPVAPPTLDEGPHLSYALQWFAFTVIGVIGIGVLVRADLRDRKKAKAAREKSGTFPDEAAGEEPSTPEPHEVG